MKKTKKNKTPKVLGSFKILSEQTVEYVKMDVEMSDDLTKCLLKRGKLLAKNNPEFYINLALVDALENGKSESA